MKVIIDRFEGEYAVVELEDKTMVNLPKVLVPGARDGDVIRIEIDVEETKKRKNQIEQLIDKMWEKA
ncbi:MAG: DUF3006 domain-containing protein [Clostridiaceae bacterium]|nr:DUF3006 domain-containing protein [Clostridiaceae bacterium]